MNKKDWCAPRKRFGQHFLEELSVIDAILQSMHLNAQDKVVEIGPGRGALTFPLLRRLSHLEVIEYDRDLCAWWATQALPSLHLISADALSVDFRQWGPGVRVVGNLPYNISTALLIHLLNAIDQIEDMHFMVQKEVADRLLAQAGEKAYGRLTVMMQAYCDIEWVLDVDPNAFAPPPKVWSSVIRLRPHRRPLPVERTVLEKALLVAFSMRRKTLANNLQPYLSASQLVSVGCDPKARPETISVGQYLKLVAEFKEEFCVSREKAAKKK